MSKILDEVLKWSQNNSLDCYSKESVTSTNDWAKKEIKNISKTPCLYVTDYQSAGRGRGTNEWISPGNGNSLLLSWVVKTEHPPQPVASPLIGLCLFRSLKNTWPQLDWQLKAPNDILIDGKKVAGILLEGIQQGKNHFLIIGIGINIFAHPPEVKTATHITNELEDSDKASTDKISDLLDWLASDLDQSLEKITRAYIEDVDCENINKALYGPKIQADGNLITEDGKTISWKDL